MAYRHLEKRMQRQYIHTFKHTHMCMSMCVIASQKHINKSFQKYTNSHNKGTYTYLVKYMYTLAPPNYANSRL